VDEEPAGVRAADVFTADLRPRPGGRLRHGARIAGAFVSELLLQLVPAPSVHDVVVARREDGAEVLRIPAGEPLRAGDLLARIRSELAQQAPEAFLAGWSEPAQPSR
jgi:hypothetical protein